MIINGALAARRRMSLDEDRALAAIRLSAGRWTTEADVDAAAGQLATAAIRVTGFVSRSS